MAPVPSPKRMQVPRSLQSTILERASAPMTRTFFAVPARMNWLAVIIASTKPEHDAVRSNATQPEIPSSACTCIPTQMAPGSKRKNMFLTLLSTCCRSDSSALDIKPCI
eukprot:CAMPEP_0117670922 /NCGR_PEP_ID=MMETSP0804-20121206/13041_1 /TAXON_ID=1074897 /ORGANISM="Tetraselmis astigmatica, Strain CCMP880" /LENGTH=108 /DNA_ID=CAMNT_0005479313 /DNA_START=5 /DNA_END=331 /DNA_ORIENTATION=-